MHHFIQGHTACMSKAIFISTLSDSHCALPWQMSKQYFIKEAARWVFFCSKPLSPPKQSWWKSPITELWMFKCAANCVYEMQLSFHTLTLSVDNCVKQSRVIRRRLTHIQTCTLVFNSETLISYFQLIIVISGSIVQAAWDAGRWGEGCDGGQARWMTQFTAHRPGIKCQFIVTLTDSMSVCVSASVCASRWLSFYRFSF